jgi:hypothetical protein
MGFLFERQHPCKHSYEYRLKSLACSPQRDLRLLRWKAICIETLDHEQHLLKLSNF